MKKKDTLLIWILLRFSMAFILLWAFFDKVFGLGFSTPSNQSWLRGVSPTAGYLTFGTTGIFSSVLHAISGSPLIDWLFMMGLLLIGLSLLLGVGMKVAGYAGAVLMFLLYLSAVPSKTNPLIDEHIIYIFVLLGLSTAEAGKVYGLGNWWSKTTFVKHHPFLQ